MIRTTYKKLFGILENVDSNIAKATNHTDFYVDPIRKSAFRRFPTLFTLLVTFGATATLLGLQRLIEEVALLHDRPIIMLSIGILILVLTGKLYKKLG